MISPETSRPTGLATLLAAGGARAVPANRGRLPRLLLRPRRKAATPYRSALVDKEGLTNRTDEAVNEAQPLGSRLSNTRSHVKVERDNPLKTMVSPVGIEPTTL